MKRSLLENAQHNRYRRRPADPGEAPDRRPALVAHADGQRRAAGDQGGDPS